VLVSRTSHAVRNVLAELLGKKTTTAHHALRVRNGNIHPIGFGLGEILQRMTHDAARPGAGLLHHVREFVSEQPSSRAAAGVVAALSKVDVATLGKRECVDGTGQRGPALVCVDAHGAEVVAKPRFHEPARFTGQGNTDPRGRGESSLELPNSLGAT